MKTKVLIAGVAGASLGTELAKCLRLAPDMWELHGADIHPLAFGLHANLFERTVVLERTNYLGELAYYCQRESIDYVIPGSDQTAKLITQKELPQSVWLVGNSPALIASLADKRALFGMLGNQGCPTWDIRNYRDAFYPAVIKPAKDSGGSTHCYLVDSPEQARHILDYLLELGMDPLVQEYFPGMEVTVGVLSRPDGTLDGSIAMERVLNSKLTIRQATWDGVISTGYSQGRFMAWSDRVNRVCERLANELKSTGPLNFQGRVTADGRLMIFEINARFSASCYLRALAGFNEPQRALLAMRGTPEPLAHTRCLTILRSLTETVVND